MEMASSSLSAFYIRPAKWREVAFLLFWRL